LEPASHVHAGELALHPCIVPALEPPRLFEERGWEEGDVSGGEDAGIRRAQVLVDDDTVADLQAGALGERDRWRDAERYQHDVGVNARSALRARPEATLRAL